MLKTFYKHFSLWLIISLFLHSVLLALIFIKFSKNLNYQKKHKNIMEISLKNEQKTVLKKYQITKNGFKSQGLNMQKINDMIKNTKSNSFIANDDNFEKININEQKLDSWQWQQHSFFYRLKQKIAQNWHPQKQMYMFDPQGNLLGSKDRATLIKVTIDNKGNLIKAHITKSSDVAYLDEEALSAIKLAQPFINPPKELFIKDSLFSFDFGFFVYLNKNILDFL